jgi:hypothetical protein
MLPPPLSIPDISDIFILCNGFDKITFRRSMQAECLRSPKRPIYDGAKYISIQ